MPDITTYTDALASVVADEAADHVEFAVNTYRDLSTGDKARARTAVNAAMLAAVNDLDITTAKRLGDLQVAQSEKVAAASVTVDWNERIALRIVSLRLAASQIATGGVRPSSVPEDVEIDWDAVKAFMTTFDTETTDYIETATKIASQPIGGTRAAGGDVAAHIIEALSQAPTGTEMTVAMIRSAETEAYPEGATSSGAISARLKAGTVDGVTVIEADDDGPLRAKLA